MSVIAPDEKADYVAILHRHQLAETDFMLQETDTTDVVDEVYPLHGYVTIIRKSTLKEREYQIGHGTAWTVELKTSLRVRSGEPNLLIPNRQPALLGVSTSG